MKFNELFREPKHYRSDCAMLRRAINSGWLRDVPQEDRDALYAAFVAAIRQQEEAGHRSTGSKARALLAMVRTHLAMDADNLRLLKKITDIRAALCYGYESTTGRPREKWHVGDYSQRLDANAVRKQALAEGEDPGAVKGVILKLGCDGEDDHTHRAEVQAVPDPRYGHRLWLRCPRCGKRQRYLYPTRSGVRCRTCTGIVYPDKRGRKEAPDIESGPIAKTSSTPKR